MVVIPKNIKSDKTVKKDYYRIFIYGKPTIGKTQLVDKLPNTLMLNTDGNINYISSPYILLKDTIEKDRRGEVKTIPLWEMFKGVMVGLVDDENGYETLVIDLIDDLYTSCRLYTFEKENIDHESDDAFRAWDKVTLEFLTVIKALMGLPYNIIFIGHEKEIRDVMTKGSPLIGVQPSLRLLIADKIKGWCDFTARYDNTIREGRTLQLIECNKVYAGSHVPNTPNKINADITEILNILKKGEDE